MTRKPKKAPLENQAHNAQDGRQSSATDPLAKDELTDGKTPQKSQTPPIKPPQIQNPPTKKQKRKITEDDINDICKVIMMNRCTERDACLLLDIKPESFWEWKCRRDNGTKYANALSRVREAKIGALVSGIDAAGDGLLPGQKAPDWRAKAWLLERQNPDRFGQAKEEPKQVENRILVGITSELAKMAFAPNELEIKTIPALPESK